MASQITYYDSMKQNRLTQGISIGRLSQMSGVNESSISLYETGKQVPGLMNLMALADALNISIDRYVGYQPKRRSIFE